MHIVKQSSVRIMYMAHMRLVRIILLYRIRNIRNQRFRRQDMRIY